MSIDFILDRLQATRRSKTRPARNGFLLVLVADCLVLLFAGAAPAADTNGQANAFMSSKPRPTRLPMTRFPSRLPPIVSEAPEAKSTATISLLNPGEGRVEKPSQVDLLAPQPMEINVDDKMTSTDFDLTAFDQSITSTLAAGWPLRRRRLPNSPIDPWRQDEDGLGDGLLGDGLRGDGLRGDGLSSGAYSNDFSPTPIPQSSMTFDPFREEWAYDAKRDVPTQHPWVEWGRIFYGNGITPRGLNCIGPKNMVRPEFYVYGDFRSGIATGRNAAGRIDNWANRLNLDMDLQLTDTGRFHSFVGPLDEGADVTRWELVDDDLRYVNRFDMTPVTGYFEGDLGVMLGNAFDETSPFELPIAIGLIPLVFQNGIWMEDAVTGAAISFPARHSRLLNWSNYDATFFAIFDQLNSPAFGANEHAAQAFGTAWFIEAYHGYIETGYAYVRDRNVAELSYHNITASYTRRYFDRISNSLRVIVNAGQDLPSEVRTADGVLLLVENSWITPMPLRVVPYANFFVGWERPQSVARAGVAGGILRNTGINFETDALNGYPTLDPTGNDSAGGSIGIDLLGADLDRQLLMEIAYVTPHGSQNISLPGDQYAVGARYQFPISNSTLLRFDSMYGWRQGLKDVYGTRMEYRWKF